jgi:SAM-dependent methyltransferase
MDYRSQFFEESKAIVGGLSGLSVCIPGCGPGNDCIPFVAAGAYVTGLDIGADLGVGFRSPQVRYHRGSIEGCDLPSDSFDVVFCIATMEHVQNMEGGFAEMVRLARPGGIIYSVAAPLWNSRRGHHLNCLDVFPWIHLRLAPAEIACWARERGIKHEDIELEHVMDFLFISDYFNRAPSHRYLAACRDLCVTKVARHDLWMDGQEDLTPEVRAELELLGYGEAELLATGHTFIARK